MLTRPANPDELFAHSQEFLNLINRQAYWHSEKEAKKNVNDGEIFFRVRRWRRTKEKAARGSV
jgi:hypothetical protein